jgi:single-stranded-DNA-specific exonuclease
MPSLPAPASPAARAFARQLQMSVTAADVLQRRGFTDEPTVRRFLAPRLAALTPPETMIGRGEAADRLARAVRGRERVVVYGDYDCDGITATAILTEALRALGGDVTPLLATRFDGGYGLSAPALARVLAARPAVLVTCDCGSADLPRVAAAKEAGVDVIVIDHHLVPPEPLPALAFLNPHRPECGFPYKGLASCGLALSVAAAVRAKLGAQLDVKAYLDLVAIGTVADVAPLDGDNRALVRAGFEAIRSGGRPGIAALCEYARLDLKGPLTAQDISFGLAPRINAPGRMGAPDIALQLLLARDLTEARKAAAACEQANQQRHDVQQRMVEEAAAQAAMPGLEGRAGLVLARAGWHPGVVGIVAGRLASQLRRPVIVAAVDAAGGGHSGAAGESGEAGEAGGPIATGSVRTYGNIPLYTALERCRDVLLGFGGHQKAAGASFRFDRLAEVAEAFSRACAELGGEAASQAPPFAEVMLDPDDDPSQVLRDITLFEPCGEANRAPLLCLADVTVKSAREVKGGHLKLDLVRGGRIIGAFGMNMGHLASRIGARVHVAGSLRRDSYRGGDAVELRAEAVIPA